MVDARTVAWVLLILAVVVVLVLLQRTWEAKQERRKIQERLDRAHQESLARDRAESARRRAEYLRAAQVEEPYRPPPVPRTERSRAERD